MASDATCLVLAAAPSTQGARALVAKALAGATPVPVLLSGEGLAWAHDPELQEAREAGRARLALCTQSGREAGWTPQQAPRGIAWSSVGVWLLRHARAANVWTVLP